LSKEAQFKEIFQANSKKIYHLCYGYTGDDETANDLMQETFMKVWQNLDKFRNQALISTWIYRIAVNTCLSYLRVEKRQSKDELTDTIIETKGEEISERTNRFQLFINVSPSLKKMNVSSSPWYWMNYLMPK